MAHYTLLEIELFSATLIGAFIKSALCLSVVSLKVVLQVRFTIEGPGTHGALHCANTIVSVHSSNVSVVVELLCKAF